jgi:transposase-like protein
MSATRHTESVEVILKDQHRRRWSLAEKSALVRRTYEPGMSVSLMARQEGPSMVPGAPVRLGAA